MRKKWILVGLAVGLLTAAITGSVGLAWGGGGHGWGRGNNDERQAAVAAKVAATLGTDEQETADAIAQAQQEVRDEAQEAALQDFAGRVADTLGTETDATADALKQVAEEMRSEALEAKLQGLQGAVDSGEMTEDEAQELRDKAATGGWHGKGLGFKGGNAQDFADRVGALLEVDGEALDGDDVADAMDQAMADIRSEALETRLQAAIDSGKITEEEAEEIREKIDSGDWKGFGKHRWGHHGGEGHGKRGRGHHGGRGADNDPTATPASAGDGDSA